MKAWLYVWKEYLHARHLWQHMKHSCRLKMLKKIICGWSQVSATHLRKTNVQNWIRAFQKKADRLLLLRYLLIWISCTQRSITIKAIQEKNNSTNHLMSIILRSRSMSCISAIFSSWKKQRIIQQKLIDVKCKINTRMIKIMVFAWSNNVTILKLLRKNEYTSKRLATFLSKQRNKRLTLEAWNILADNRCYSSMTKKLEYVFTKQLGNQMIQSFKKTQSKHFLWWKRKTGQESKLKYETCKTKKKMIKKAMIIWKQHVIQTQNHRLQSEKIIRRWLQTGLWRAFAKWQQATCSMKHLRCVGRRVIGRWMQGTLSQCFGLWAAAVDQAAEEQRESAERVRRISMAHDAVCHLVLSVWIRKHLQNVHALGSMYIMNVESMPTVLDRLVSNSRVSPCIEYDAHRSELPLILNVSRYESGSLFNYQESFEMSSRSLYTPER